eukprot:TRINITY_DN33844_c0_g1_i1.p2 TRINITY_DN33844_c0_g1~~TRINITY_DN33844_c0_g1_i1.p2  ORF type:complete len:217 (+),score=23.87 TRINITY_DN33844_c0_g1_i1:75-725(+)
MAAHAAPGAPWGAPQCSAPQYSAGGPLPTGGGGAHSPHASPNLYHSLGEQWLQRRAAEMWMQQPQSAPPARPHAPEGGPAAGPRGGAPPAAPRWDGPSPHSPAAAVRPAQLPLAAAVFDEGPPSPDAIRRQWRRDDAQRAAVQRRSPRRWWQQQFWEVYNDTLAAELRQRLPRPAADREHQRWWPDPSEPSRRIRDRRRRELTARGGHAVGAPVRL